MGDINFLPNTSCDSSNKTAIQGCANGVPHLVLICDSECGVAPSVEYLNLATGVSSAIPPTGFQALSCDVIPNTPCITYLETETFFTVVGQTSFSLANIPSGDVRFSRNGSTISDLAATVSGSNVTYNPSQNNSESLLANDRIDITYVYDDCDQIVQGFTDCKGDVLSANTAIVTCAALSPTDFSIDGNGVITVIGAGVSIEGSDCITVTGTGTNIDPFVIGSTSCGSTETCATQFKDVVALPASNSVVINHNLDLSDPYAFLLTHYNMSSGAIANISITNVTANSFTIVNNSTTFALDYVVNVQRNEACDATSLNCNYQYIDAVNTTKTLTNGTVATVDSSTGVSFKTFQGITGWNLGDLEDNEKINTTFSNPIKKLRILIEAGERISGVYEKVKIFINGSPYAVQASEFTTPLNSGGSFSIIDAGLTLEPNSGSDDASCMVIIDVPAGINSVSLQNIVVSGSPNGVVARLEVKECI